MMTVKPRQRKATTDAGIRLTRMPGSLLRGECPVCDEVTYVASKLGSMLCAHCGQPIPDWAWGSLSPVFIPEVQS